jgi:hypothetical protein
MLVPDESVYRIVDAIDEVAEETGRTVPQIALNWLLQRPSVASVIIGAGIEEHTPATSAPSAGISPRSRSPAASATTLPYPYWHQRQFTERNPAPV